LHTEPLQVRDGVLFPFPFLFPAFLFLLGVLACCMLGGFRCDGVLFLHSVLSVLLYGSFWWSG